MSDSVAVTKAAVSGTVDSVAEGTGRGIGKAATTTGSRALIAFSAIGILVDIFVIGLTVKDLRDGSKTTVAKRLREVADKLKEEIQYMKSIHDILADEINPE